MTHARLIIGLVALAAAIICALLGFTRIGGDIGAGTWTVYPAALFALIAAFQLYGWLRSLWQREPESA